MEWIQLESVCLEHNINDRYTKFRELLVRDDIDAVDVCLHNNYHAPATIVALDSGKHVYCKKPIAGAYRDGADMLEAAAYNGRKLHIQLATPWGKNIHPHSYATMGRHH